MHHGVFKTTRETTAICHHRIAVKPNPYVDIPFPWVMSPVAPNLSLCILRKTQPASTKLRCLEGSWEGRHCSVEVFYILFCVHVLVPQSASVTLRVRSALCVPQTAASASVAQTWSGETATCALRLPSILGPTAAEVRALWSSMESNEPEPPVERVRLSCVVHSVRLWPSGLAGSLLRSADRTVHLLSGGVQPAVWPLSAGPLGLPHMSTLLLQRTRRRVRAGHRPLHRLPGPQHWTRLRQVSWRTATLVICDWNRLQTLTQHHLSLFFTVPQVSGRLLWRPSAWVRWPLPPMLVSWRAWQPAAVCRKLLPWWRHTAGHLCLQSWF